MATIERGIRPEAIALAIFALALACTALLIVGQAATRLLLGAGADNPVLAALGMTRGQLLAAALIEIAVAGKTGAILAAGVAVDGLATDADRGGPARRARPGGQRGLARAVRRRGDHRGAAGRPRPMAGLAARLGPRDRRARGGRGPARPSWLAGWLAGAGAPVTVTTGARLAMEPGRGRTAVPVRAALAGTTLSVLAVTAAFTFGANLLHLVHSPRLYGQAWGTPRSICSSRPSSRARPRTCSAPIRASPAGPTAITASSGSRATWFRRSALPPAAGR